MSRRILFVAFALLCGFVAHARGVEMFTHFDDGQRLGFEPLNAVKKSYPGYRLPDGRRVPVAAPNFYPAIPGSSPWKWSVNPYAPLPTAPRPPMPQTPNLPRVIYVP